MPCPRRLINDKPGFNRHHASDFEKEFQAWSVGARVPCWYDPADPADIVLKRGFGGAYLFALLPLFPFWIGWRILRSCFSRGA